MIKYLTLQVLFYSKYNFNMLKLLQTKFIKTPKNMESLINEGYIFNCGTEKKVGRKFKKCKHYYAGASKWLQKDQK